LDAVITVKDLDDTITRDSILQAEFSASKKQGNKSGIYQEAKKTTVTGRRREYAYYGTSGKVEDTENNITTPRRIRRTTFLHFKSTAKEDFPLASWGTLTKNMGKDTVVVQFVP